MMATVIGAVPGRLLSASHPLARHPPTADFLRLFRVFYVQNQCNVADVTFHVGRKVGIVPVKGKSMHSLRGGFEERDLSRLRTIRDVKDFEAALRFVLVSVALIIDEHHIAAHANIVRVNALWYF